MAAKERSDWFWIQRRVLTAEFFADIIEKELSVYSLCGASPPKG